MLSDVSITLPRTIIKGKRLFLRGLNMNKWKQYNFVCYIIFTHLYLLYHFHLFIYVLYRQFALFMMVVLSTCRAALAWIFLLKFLSKTLVIRCWKYQFRIKNVNRKSPPQLIMIIVLSGVQFGLKSSKSNERPAWVRFEITSMISDQN